jgi:CHAT domain-containing protein/tetratricopeptide (TPR) repeat protein
MGEILMLRRNSLYAAAVIVFVTFWIALWATAAHAQGSDDVDALSKQVAQLAGAGKYAEATAIAARALDLAERRFGPDHPTVSTALNNLAFVYSAQGRYSEAEPLYQRALAIAEKALGPDHPNVASDLGNLAELYRALGRSADAEPLYKRALMIHEKALGGDHPQVGQELNNLGALYFAQGRYGEAESLYKRALIIAEKALGPDHRDVGTYLNNLAGLYGAEGRYAEAEPLYRRALAIEEKALGADHPEVALDLNNLGLLYRAQGRPVEAEPLYKRALAIDERALGSEHPNVSIHLNNLAELYISQDRYAEAEPLLKRALAIDEKGLGPDHAQVGTRLNNLAEAYRAQGRYAEAEPLFKRAVSIDEKALGPDHPDVGRDLNNLAAVYIAQLRYAEAEPLLKRALALAEKALGSDNAQVGIHLGILAELYREQGHYGDAEPLIKRALAIHESALGSDHLYVGNDLNNLAMNYFAQSDWVHAVDYWRESTGVIISRARRGAVGGESLTGKRKSEASQVSWRFRDLIKAAFRQQAARDETTLLREMFQTAQWAQSSEAAESLALMAARGAKGGPKISALIRERQDLVAEWQRRDQAHSAAVAQPPEHRNRDAEAENTSRLAAIEARIATIDKNIAADFPDYAALVAPTPLSVESVRTQLAAGEAMVLFLDTAELKPTPEETFIWVVTKGEARWLRSDLGTKSLAREVAALRCGLDATAWWRDTACAELTGIRYTEADYAGGEPLPFDVGRAHALYKSLLGNAEDLIKGKHVLIVPSGALTTLPFQVLVTKPPASNDPASAAWFIRDHAITVLPSVASLAALRRTAKPSTATKPMIGFGNPLLEGNQSHPRDGAYYKELADMARSQIGCAATLKQRTALLRAPSRSFTPVTQMAGTADLADLKRQTPLPETADELCAVARSLGADTGEIRIGKRFTETEVKRLSMSGELASYRILHFATHGVLAGQLSGTREPGLILTPPTTATADDDGYLSGSEIAALKLDAEWVILSACNTAGGAGQGEAAEALSGLARVFFYAGARALLVSHWEVDSAATVKLITTAMGALAKDKSLGRAKALRSAMLSVMADTSRPSNWVPASHPSVWAPFVVVGEGGGGR